MDKEWETLVGLEVHAELCTDKKLFCDCANRFGAQPNTLCCPVCCGRADTAPKLNEQAVHFSLRLGLALGCKINRVSQFDRKHYQYPDLPKGYQITQQRQPICEAGRLPYWLEGVAMEAEIERIQLEEDTAKLSHGPAGELQIDHNRCGVPLVEIITRPQVQSGKQAKALLEALAATMMAVEVCDGKAHEGSLRADVNVSVRPVGQAGLPPRCELKNISGFAAVARAVEAEAARQKVLYQLGEPFIPETRQWDDKNRKSILLRSKESTGAHQYTPETLLPPLHISEKDVCKQKNCLPMLPWQKYNYYIEELDLPYAIAALLANRNDMSLFFEHANEYKNCEAKELASMILGDFTASLNRGNLTLQKQAITPWQLSKLVGMIGDGTLSALAAKGLLVDMMQTGASAEVLAQERGLLQNNNSAYLSKIVRYVAKENPQAVQDYTGGKTAILSFLVGQGMKKSQGRANPVLLQKLMAEYLAVEGGQTTL